MTFLVLFIVLFIMLTIGVPVGFAIGGATMFSMYFCSNLNMVVNAQYCFSGINSFTVMAIPFFMLAGLIMSTGGIAKRIVNFASALIDFVTGALGCVTILACMFFGALSGSGMATTSAIGGMMIPEMKKKGYSSEYAATLVCFGGIVGPIIPPSLSFVLYGATTNTPVPELFLAGVLPGVFLGLIFLLMNILICKKTKTEVRKVEEGKVVTLKEILQNIGEIKTNEEYQKDTTEEELLEMIEDEKQKLKNINLVLEKILNTDFKPKMEIFMYLKYECWLLDYPQHLIIDEN